MVCALVCHQLLEGLGLGACITAVRQHLSRRKIIAIVAVFSLAFPAAGEPQRPTCASFHAALRSCA
jgi:hypothetical protein